MMVIHKNLFCSFSPISPSAKHQFGQSHSTSEHLALHEESGAELMAGGVSLCDWRMIQRGRRSLPCLELPQIPLQGDMAISSHHPPQHTFSPQSQPFSRAWKGQTLTALPFWGVGCGGGAQQRALSLMPPLVEPGWVQLLAFGFVSETEKPRVRLQHVGITLITAIFLLEERYFFTFILETGTNCTCVVQLTINLPH